MESLDRNAPLEWFTLFNLPNGRYYDVQGYTLNSLRKIILNEIMNSVTLDQADRIRYVDAGKAINILCCSIILSC